MNLGATSPYIVPALLENTSQVLRARTGFHTDKALWKVCDELCELSAVQLVPAYGLPRPIASNEVKPALADIDTNGLDLHDGVSDELTRASIIRAGWNGAGHPISSRVCPDQARVWTVPRGKHQYGARRSK